MTVAFDLISDLHVETWNPLDWTGQATSPYCVVAGDVARDRGRLLEALEHLGQCYPGGVFYIDGNEEHKNQLDDLGSSYQDLAKDLQSIKNVVWMQDNVIIIKGVAFLGTNPILISVESANPSSINNANDAMSLPTFGPNPV